METKFEFITIPKNVDGKQDKIAVPDVIKIFGHTFPDISKVSYDSQSDSITFHTFRMPYPGTYYIIRNDFDVYPAFGNELEPFTTNILRRNQTIKHGKKYVDGLREHQIKKIDEELAEYKELVTNNEGEAE